MKKVTPLNLSGFNMELLQDFSFYANLFPVVFLTQTFKGTVRV